MKKRISPRDIIFSVVLCGALCFPGALYVATHKMDAKVPGWLTMTTARYLQGYWDNVNVKKYVSGGGFLSGDLQNAFEDFLSENIPAKGVALLTNAAVQRSAIEASNVLFNWPCYPSFYSSTIGVDALHDRLFELPTNATDYAKQAIGKRAQAMTTFAERHADLRTFVYIAPDAGKVDDGPAVPLMSNPETYSWICEEFLSNKGDALLWIDGQVSEEDILKWWYKTDHHWNTLGAFDAYIRIAKALGFGEELLEPSGAQTIEQPRFYGASARVGLDGDYYDEVTELLFDSFPEYAVAIDGKEVAESELFETDLDAITWQSNQFANRYTELYHTDFATIEITNPASDSNKGLLIVGDSYTNCMERFLAAHYKTTYVFDPRNTSTTLDEFLAEHEDISDIVFLMRRANMFNVATLNAMQD